MPLHTTARSLPAALLLGTIREDASPPPHDDGTGVGHPVGASEDQTSLPRAPGFVTSSDEEDSESPKQSIRGLQAMVSVLVNQVEDLEARLVAIQSPEHDRRLIADIGELTVLKARLRQLESERGQLDLAYRRIRVLEQTTLHLKHLLRESADRLTKLPLGELRYDLLRKEKQILLMGEEIKCLKEDRQLCHDSIQRLHGQTSRLSGRVSPLTSTMHERRVHTCCKCALL